MCIRDRYDDGRYFFDFPGERSKQFGFKIKSNGWTLFERRNSSNDAEVHQQRKILQKLYHQRQDGRNTERHPNLSGDRYQNHYQWSRCLCRFLSRITKFQLRFFAEVFYWIKLSLLKIYMKNFISILFILCSFFVSAQTKNITSSEIRWKAYKTLKAESMSHDGTVKLKSGNLTFNGNELTGGNFIINMNTIDAEDMNENPKQKKFLENHLKSDDFFDVEKFPVTVFQIKSVKKINDKNYNYQIGGILTIKGISKNISFPVKVAQNNSVFTLTSAQFTFNRKHFGLKYNIFEDMLISNDVEMKVKIVAQ